MKFIKWLLLIVIGCYIIAFSVYNRQSISINFPLSPSYIDVPLYLFFFITIFSGIIIGGIAILLHKISTFSDSRKDKKKITLLENEVESLRLEGKIVDNFDEETQS